MQVKLRAYGSIDLIPVRHILENELQKHVTHYVDTPGVVEVLQARHEKLVTMIGDFMQALAEVDEGARHALGSVFYDYELIQEAEPKVEPRKPLGPGLDDEIPF